MNNENKSIEIPFGAKDSELGGFEYTIPEGFEAVIENGKIIVRKTESEDERIRKGLIAIITDFERLYLQENYSLSREETLSWLEKQGEQKPEWSEEDKSMMDNLILHLKVAYSQCDWLDETINWLKSLKDRVLPKQKQEWSEEDETTKNNISHIIRQYDKISKKENQPCWYVGDCLLWMQNIKYRVQPQPKQEWNSGDDAHLHSLITHLEDFIASHPNTTGADIQGENVAWLKSIRPQKQWKPTGEQIEALEGCVDFLENSDNEDLFVMESLLEQLKAL